MRVCFGCGYWVSPRVGGRAGEHGGGGFREHQILHFTALKSEGAGQRLDHFHF